ncbi:MAG: hypothetical protein ACR2K5_11875 [Pseudolabrys sp.]
MSVFRGKALVCLVAIVFVLAPAASHARNSGGSGAKNSAKPTSGTTAKKLPGKSKPPTLTLKRGKNQM